MTDVNIHSMLINAGVRPVALTMVTNEQLEECINTIKAEGLKTVLNPRGKTHTSVYMFKHPCVENVINFVLEKPHNRKALIQWINGKMFGYSDEEIKKHIEG